MGKGTLFDFGLTSQWEAVKPQSLAEDTGYPASSRAKSYQLTSSQVSLISST